MATIKLDLSRSFPFDAPSINIELKDNERYYALYNMEQLSFEDVMREHWHPSIKLADIAEKTVSFVEKNIIKIK